MVFWFWFLGRRNRIVTFNFPHFFFKFVILQLETIKCFVSFVSCVMPFACHSYESKWKDWKEKKKTQTNQTPVNHKWLFSGNENRNGEKTFKIKVNTQVCWRVKTFVLFCLCKKKKNRKMSNRSSIFLLLHNRRISNRLCVAVFVFRFMP